MGAAVILPTNHAINERDSLHQRLLRGEYVQVGTGIYALCGECGSIVQVNKLLFGSLHLCATRLADTPEPVEQVKS